MIYRLHTKPHILKVHSTSKSSNLGTKPLTNGTLWRTLNQIIATLYTMFDQLEIVLGLMSLYSKEKDKQ
jgi:hypothetical protein